MKIIRKAVNKLLRDCINLIFPYIPKKKNRIYVSSFNGKFADSPKVIAKELKTQRPDLEVVYLINEKKSDFPQIFIPSVAGSWKDRWYLASSVAIVDNMYGWKMNWLKNDSVKSVKIYNSINEKNRKKNQKVYSTWHGTPLKKMGRDIVGSDIIDFDCPNTTMFLGNKHTIEVMDRLTFGKVRMVLSGSPRNDQLIKNNFDVRMAIKKKIGVLPDKKIAMFAPTFRDESGDGYGANVYMSGIKQLEELPVTDFLYTLEKKFGGEWVLVCRFHYFVDNQIDWEAINKKYPGVILNGNALDDMADYLLVSDVLLTDASSCMFDFALTYKPCFMFFPDYDQYKNIQRGFYFEECQLPFKISKTYNELKENIMNYDDTNYKQNVDSMLALIGNAEDGHAAERIASYIISDLFS